MSFELFSNSDVIKADSMHKVAHDLAILYLKDEVSKNDEIDISYPPSLNSEKIVEEYNHLRHSFIESLDKSGTFI